MIRDMSTVNKCPKFRSPKTNQQSPFCTIDRNVTDVTDVAPHSAEIFKVDITSDPNFQAPWLSGDSKVGEDGCLKERFCLVLGYSY